jgi:hypothetical protein
MYHGGIRSMIARGLRGGGVGVVHACVCRNEVSNYTYTDGIYKVEI